MTSTAKFLKWLFVALVSLMPVLALAANANPDGGTDWELFVYGNGQVVYEIFTGIKLLMVPDAGETGFRSLLLVLATIGFLVLAIAAGFDPGKNLMKMFAYVFVIWGVIFSATGLTANVLIVDLVRDDTAIVGSDNRVSNAPALVVIPAAFTSSVGKYFTEAMEAYYSTPEEFKLSGSVAGQFNLFGKMLSEATQYRLKSSELKRSLSAYSADCVVPAIALGRLTGPGLVPETGAVGTLTGTSALLGSTNMVQTLSSASSPAILTTYFPYSTTDTAWVATASSERSIDTSAAALTQYGGSGLTLSCSTAWTILSADLAKHAAVLLEADSQAWEKTGTAVPFETAFTQMLEKTYKAGGTTYAGYSQPQGFILQTAMVNSMRGTFRNAAVQNGNNEVLQSVMLTQAESQQKSAWTASFHVFNNMMGYVFTVLQAFIFGMTPFIVVALVIPGMGRAIFVNYAQILVWLTLWQPLLSIINFILVLFGSEAVTGVVESQGGFTMNNDALMSEKTSDLITAAGFLGTMVPLLSWGVVKGAMAFTEFITAGVGSAFATQAGAAAATGNVSLGNMSMGNTSMHKYSTMMSSQVGAQAVDTAMGAGAMNTLQDGGGSGLKMNSASVQLSSEYAKSVQDSLAESRSIGKALSAMQTEGWSLSQVKDAAASSSSSVAVQKAAQSVLSHMESVSKGSSAAETLSNTTTAGNGTQTGTKGSASEALNGTVKANLGLSVAGSGAGVGLDKKVSNSYDQDVGHNTQLGQTGANAHTVEIGKTGVGESWGSQTTNSTSTVSSSNSERRSGASESEAATLQKALSNAISENHTITQNLQQMESVASKFSASHGMSMAEYSDNMAKLEAASSRMEHGLSSVGATASGFQSGMSSMTADTGAHRSSLQSQVGARMHGSSGGGGGSGAAGFNFSEVKQNAQNDIAQAQAAGTGQYLQNAGKHASALKNSAATPVTNGGASNALNLTTPKHRDGSGGTSVQGRVDSLVNSLK